jgi:hypothetical protein
MLKGLGLGNSRHYCRPYSPSVSSVCSLRSRQLHRSSLNNGQYSTVNNTKNCSTSLHTLLPSPAAQCSDQMHPKEVIATGDVSNSIGAIYGRAHC